MPTRPLYWYPVTVAGVTFTLQTSVPLPEAEPFRPFLVGGALSGPEYLVEYREAPALAQPQGKPLYRSESYEVYPDGNGGFVRWYFDGMHDFVRFVRITEDAARHVLAEYLPARQELVGAMGNCFSFSGWEHLLLREGRMILHASCVRTRYGGLLFSGPSGIGKSTQAALWQRYRGARLINGDRPVLYRSAIGWMACGSPYAGSSRCYVNASAAVRAIVLLRQAPECALRRVCGPEAFRRVFAGLTVNSWDAASVARACDLAQALTEETPVYELACTPDLAAVRLLEQELE